MVAEQSQGFCAKDGILDAGVGLDARNCIFFLLWWAASSAADVSFGRAAVIRGIPLVRIFVWGWIRPKNNFFFRRNDHPRILQMKGFLGGPQIKLHGSFRFHVGVITLAQIPSKAALHGASFGRGRSIAHGSARGVGGVRIPAAALAPAVVGIYKRPRRILPSILGTTSIQARRCHLSVYSSSRLYFMCLEVVGLPRLGYCVIETILFWCVFRMWMNRHTFDLSLTHNDMRCNVKIHRLEKNSFCRRS